jgi:Sulfotransferase domain
MGRNRSLAGKVRDRLDWTAVQALRLVPGSRARRLRRDLRDAAWLRQADAVIISFPKSGRTFVRAMLSRLFQRRFGLDERRLLEFPMLLRAPATVPRLLFTHAGDAMRTADEIELNPRDYDHCRVVLLARHPGDVAVSRYHHLKHRSHDRARRRLARQPLDTFVWSDQGGIPAIVRFMNQWADLARSREGVGIVRYEDFLADAAGTLRRLTEQIGLDVDAADLEDAAEFGALGNLKQREREGYFESPRLRPAKQGDEQSYKVRSGSSGGYRKRLEPHEAAKVDAFVAANLDPVFGY